MGGGAGGIGVSAPDQSRITVRSGLRIAADEPVMKDQERRERPRLVEAARVQPAVRRPCPICRKPAVSAHRPFCSARCRDLDLHRWLTGGYAVPAHEEEVQGDDDR
ncbi:DNA gyrase inhibitor YacG [Marinivivus vitaminiproducens]|uniref:DNA gyrase inhibitor YacG n=1 Tax=Marinivivus vitaminiproducens TaxID=3035935 RepID=UPI003F9F07F6